MKNDSYYMLPDLREGRGGDGFTNLFQIICDHVVIMMDTFHEKKN